MRIETKLTPGQKVWAIYSAGHRVEVYEFELERSYALSKEELLKLL